MPRLRVLLACLLLIPPCAWPQGELRFITATNHAPPLVLFEAGELKGGLLVETEDALARRLGLQARHIPLPSLRVAPALRNGHADLLCHSRPQWVDGEFRWSRPLFDNAEVLAARGDAPALHQLTELRGKPVGIVRGYRYPAVERQLGDEVLRLEANDMRANLDKLLAGRMPYAFTDRITLREWQRRHPAAGLREELVLENYRSACALSPQSFLSLQEVDAALEAMQRSGELRAILRRHGQ